ncbi:Protein-disulfide isomerase [Sinosporangium album]|uniref:Protein-disulfide isomerase n=1 Tax=Sinosporangium album TaxID=504805 RepID=A0A1G7X874_9ACTN|nr:thioredoxin domain-containing protein [Sinosporangium album]SDG80398.1 Protein-disulfide isomerase [Sinosporangium album]
MGKGARDHTARERIKAQREAERKQEQRRRVATIATVGVVALAAIGAGWWYAASRSAPETIAQSLAPVTVQADGTAVMAKPGVTKPVVDVYEDFQCPACRQLELTTGSTLKNLAAEGKVKVVFHPITIFPEQLNNGITRGNSVRAGAALRCVSDGGQWLALHDKLFKEQPSEGTEGFKLPDIVAWGKDVGVTSPDFESCVTSQKHLQAHLDYGAKVKIGATPTLKLDGKEVDNPVAFDPAALRELVTNAGK